MIDVSIATAQAYFDERLYSSAWNDATVSDKTKAIKQAGKVVYAAFIWSSSAFQTVDDEIVWNDSVVQAVCEQAIHLLKNDPTQIPDVLTKGILQTGAAGMSATFDKSFVVPQVCEAAKILIGTLGTYVDNNNRVSSYPFGV